MERHFSLYLFTDPLQGKLVLTQWLPDWPNSRSVASWWLAALRLSNAWLIWWRVGANTRSSASQWSWFRPQLATMCPVLTFLWVLTPLSMRSLWCVYPLSPLLVSVLFQIERLLGTKHSIFFVNFHVVVGKRNFLSTYELGAITLVHFLRLKSSLFEVHFDWCHSRL